ncbi:glycosyltransferase family 2 protein [Paenibacillaceae bacterium]|nr:glycosyltransferase family 2 protein [Paenibacillaceae bacterium]
MADQWFKVSICICTRNRPNELECALVSLFGSTVRPHEVIVSDDSTDFRTRELIRNLFPEVQYLEGPRKGLCSNRNVALNGATGTHILFIDDDVVLGADFLHQVQGQLTAVDSKEREQLIVTGLERRNGHIVYPHDQSFLGYQRKVYRPADKMKTIVINSTVFPAGLFTKMQFDDQLRYGYDEVDLTTRAVEQGYQIRLCEAAINDHFPSEVNRDYYKTVIEASRIFVTFKRYFFSERRKLKGLVFFALAVMHAGAHALFRQGRRGPAQFWQTMKEVLLYTRNHRKRAVTGGESL